MTADLRCLCRSGLDKSTLPRISRPSPTLRSCLARAMTDTISIAKLLLCAVRFQTRQPPLRPPFSTRWPPSASNITFASARVGLALHRPPPCPCCVCACCAYCATAPNTLLSSHLLTAFAGLRVTPDKPMEMPQTHLPYCVMQVIRKFAN